MRSVSRLTSLTGRVSLVTGASGHIGKVICSTLAELGADIIILDINQQDLESLKVEINKHYPVKVYPYSCDLENTEQIDSLLQTLNNKFNKLDVLVNNAAFVGTSDLKGWSEDFVDQSVETWRRALEVNLTSVFVLTQALVGPLKRSENASIINIGSIYGVYGPDPSLYVGTGLNNPAAYAASKAGLIHFSRWLATNLAPEVRVNSISPGGIFRNQPSEFVKRYCSKTPLARMGTEEDIKGAIVYLATDLSNWVTGQNIMVDGGWGTW